MIAARLVDSEDVDRFRPILNLTERGWSIVRGQSDGPIELALPEPLANKVRLGGLQPLSTSATVPPAPAGPENRESGPAQDSEEPERESGVEPDPLRDQLRALRTQWARDANLPAFRIFSNETIEGIVLTRPRSPAELARIKGLGPMKLEKYGAGLLEAVRSASDEVVSSFADDEKAPASPKIAARPGHEPEKEKPTSSVLEEGGPDLDESPSGRPSASRSAGSNGTIGRQPIADNSTIEPAAPRPETGAYVSTEEWTWRLFDRGFSLSEVVAIRGLDRSAVIRHATWMARKGHTLAIDLVVDSDTRARWESWFQERGETAPPVSSDDERGLWGLFLLCRGRS